MGILDWNLVGRDFCSIKVDC